jgi:hypothetical protein
MERSMECQGSRVQISQLQAFSNGVLDLDYSAIKADSPDDPRDRSRNNHMATFT